MKLQSTEWGTAFVKTKAYSDRVLTILKQAEDLGPEEAFRMIVFYTAIAMCSSGGALEANEKKISKFAQRNLTEICRIVSDAVGPRIIMGIKSEPQETIQ